MAAPSLEAARYRACASRRACIRAAHGCSRRPDSSFWKAFTSAGHVAELGDIIAREAYTGRRFDLFSFQQNTQFLVTNLCALLKRDSIHAGEHQSRYNERDARRFLPCCRNGEVE